MSEHAEFSPSRLQRIILCPGSHQLCTKLMGVEPPNAAADHGTMMHAVMHEVISMDFPAATGALEVPESGFGGFDTLSEEDQEVIRETRDRLYQMLTAEHTSEEDAEGLTVCLENRVYLNTFGLPNCHGTPDVIALDERTATIHVLDYKFGRRVKVNPQYNAQLMAYAAGAIARFGAMQAVFDYNVQLHILQPYMDNFQTWTTDSQTILEWVYGTLRPALALAKEPQAYCSPGPVQCEWCLARFDCRHRKADIDNRARLAFAGFAPETAPTEELVEFWNSKQQIEKYLSDVGKFLMARALVNQAPGLKVVRGRSNRTWREEDILPKLEPLLHKYGIDETEAFQVKVKSPAQIEKLAAKLKKDEEFRQLWHNPEGALNLVSDKHPGEAVTHDPASAFAAFVTEPEIQLD